MLALVWFPWPITVAVAAAFLAVHLYFRATRNDRSVGSGAGLGLLGALSVALPAIPLAVALSAGCSDTGRATFFTPRWAVVSGVVVPWVAMLAALYRVAGTSFQSSVSWAIGVPLCAGVAAVLEYRLSEGLLEAYCNDTMPGVFTIDLIVAIVIAVGVAAAMAWRLRRDALSA